MEDTREIGSDAYMSRVVVNVCATKAQFDCVFVLFDLVLQPQHERLNFSSVEKFYELLQGLEVQNDLVDLCLEVYPSCGYEGYNDKHFTLKLYQ